MSYTTTSCLITVGLFAGMLACLEIGRRIGKARVVRDPEGARAGIGVIEGAVFGLMGLLIGFTFAGAVTRFDSRRQLIVEEANTIGTAWLRLDLLPPAAQPAMRDLFREYLDARIAGYQIMQDEAMTAQHHARANAIQSQIWSNAVQTTRMEGGQSSQMLLLPALNQMFDITSTRALASQTHPPRIIFYLLFALTLISALLAGYGMAGGKGRSNLHMLTFAAIMAISVYVILDIEYPRKGLIRLDSVDQYLVNVRQSMK